MEWINNEVRLYNTGNYIQYLVINHNRKNIRMHVCVHIYIELNHFAVWQKLTKHCKATILEFFFFTLFYFTVLYWFCHTLTWIHHGCIQAPNPESPSHLPPHIISLDHPHAPAPSIVYPVSNIDWHFVSYMIVYMFQCHSPKSSHPLPLDHSPKVCSTHLCLFCCLTYRVIITIFLNSVYMCQYTILVFFFPHLF